MKPDQLIAHLAHVAARFAAASGTGGCEAAGLIVSYLAANPDQINDFLDHGFSRMVDDPNFHWHNGCLSWHAMSGSVVSPSDVRAMKGVRDA